MVPPVLPVALPPLLVVVPPVSPLPPLLGVVPPVSPLPPLLGVAPPLPAELAPPLDAPPAPPTDVADLPPDDELPPDPESAVVRWQAQPHTTTPHKTSLSQVVIRMFYLPYPGKSGYVELPTDRGMRARSVESRGTYHRWSFEDSTHFGRR